MLPQYKYLPKIGYFYDNLIQYMNNGMICIVLHYSEAVYELGCIIAKVMSLIKVTKVMIIVLCHLVRRTIVSMIKHYGYFNINTKY